MAEPEIRMWKPGDPEPKWIKERTASRKQERDKNLAAAQARIEPYERAARDVSSKSDVLREKGQKTEAALWDAAEKQRNTWTPEDSKALAEKYPQKPRKGFAKGGKVSGKGTKDTVKARLTPGEFVVTKRATARHGDLLQKINRGGGATRYRST